MSGLWLENGMHYNITYEYAKEIAEEMEKNGSVFLGDTEVRMVLPVREVHSPRDLDNSKRLKKILSDQPLLVKDL